MAYDLWNLATENLRTPSIDVASLQQGAHYTSCLSMCPSSYVPCASLVEQPFTHTHTHSTPQEHCFLCN